MSALLSLAYIGSSIFIFPGLGDSVREPKWLWVFFFSLACLTVRIRTFRWKPFFLFIPISGWAFLLHMFAQGWNFSRTEEWAIYLGSILACTLLAFFLVTERKDLFRESSTQLALAISIYLALALSILQFFNLDPIFERVPVGEKHMKLAGLLGQFTIHGAWMATMAWFCWANRKIHLFLLCTVACFLSFSAFAAFSWIAGLLATLVWHRRWKIALLLLSCFCFFAVYQMQVKKSLFFFHNGRLPIWKHTVAATLENPWLGFGTGTYARKFPAFHQGIPGNPWRQAHNEFIQLFYEGGLIGCVLLLGTLLLILIHRKRWWRKDSAFPWFLVFICLFANSLGNFPWHIAPMALFFITSYFMLLRAPHS